MEMIDQLIDNKRELNDETIEIVKNFEDNLSNDQIRNIFINNLVNLEATTILKLLKDDIELNISDFYERFTINDIYEENDYSEFYNEIIEEFMSLDYIHEKIIDSNFLILYPQFIEIMAKNNNIDQLVLRLIINNRYDIINDHTFIKNEAINHEEYGKIFEKILIDKSYFFFEKDTFLTNYTLPTEFIYKQNESVDKYQIGAPYINDAIRSGGIFNSYYINDLVNKIVKEIDMNGKNYQDLILFRGRMDKTDGNIIEDKGFMSKSSSYPVTLSYSNHKCCRGIYYYPGVSRHLYVKKTDYEYLKEFITYPGERFKLIGYGYAKQYDSPKHIYEWDKEYKSENIGKIYLYEFIDYLPRDIPDKTLDISWNECYGMLGIDDCFLVLQSQLKYEIRTKIDIESIGKKFLGFYDPEQNFFTKCVIKIFLWKNVYKYISNTEYKVLYTIDGEKYTETNQLISTNTLISTPTYITFRTHLYKGEIRDIIVDGEHIDLPKLIYVNNDVYIIT